MLLVSMREDQGTYHRDPEQLAKWVPAALFDNSGDAQIFAEGVDGAYHNMETKTEQIEGDVYKIAKGESNPRLEMMELVKEDLNKLDIHEIGKVYKFIRRKIIADIPED